MAKKFFRPDTREQLTLALRISRPLLFIAGASAVLAGASVSINSCRYSAATHYSTEENKNQENTSSETVLSEEAIVNESIRRALLYDLIENHPVNYIKN